MTFSTEAEAREYLKKGMEQFGTTKNMPIVIPSTHGCWVLAAPNALEMAALTCSICGQQFHEFGNNARPVNDGRCCNYCDEHVVIPARIAIVEAGQ